MLVSGKLPDGTRCTRTQRAHAAASRQSEAITGRVRKAPRERNANAAKCQQEMDSGHAIKPRAFPSTVHADLTSHGWRATKQHCRATALQVQRITGMALVLLVVATVATPCTATGLEARRVPSRRRKNPQPRWQMARSCNGAATWWPSAPGRSTLPLPASAVRLIRT